MTQLHFSAALLPDGWAQDVRIGIERGRIVLVETGVPPEAGDSCHPVAVPGLPNVHSHAFQRAMAGLVERCVSGQDSFWSWRETMYRFLARIGPDELRAIAAMAYLEMLESGCTRVGEFHYLHNAPDGRPYARAAAMAEAVCAAAEETGIALTLLPVFYAYAGFGEQPPQPEQSRFVLSLDRFANRYADCAGLLRALPDACLGLAPHSLRAVSPDQLARLTALAPGGPVHIHVAEQQYEVDRCLEWSGARPVEWLLANAPVGPNWCLVHATHMVPDEVAGLAQSRAVAGLCPITEANLGDGLFPARAYLDHGGRLAIGTDSNVMIDMTEELRWLEYGQRLAGQRRSVFASAAGSNPGRQLLQGALEGGQQALGREGGLATGRPADFVTLDTSHPSLVGRSGDDLLDGWIFAAGRAAVDGVWRAGRRVVAGGRHHNRAEVTARYRKVLEDLLS